MTGLTDDDFNMLFDRMDGVAEENRKMVEEKNVDIFIGVTKATRSWPPEERIEAASTSSSE